MKKIKSILLTTVLCLSLSACEKKENFNQTVAFENMKSYYSNEFDSEDYYIQISKTKAEAHIMTEASKHGDDYAFMEYDVSGALKYYRNNKLTTLSPETFYQAEEKDAKWTDFSYENTAQTYKEVLNTLCLESDSIFKEITFEETEDKNYPYKISANINLDNIDEKTLFKSGGNFGSVSIKFLSDESGKNFDEISLYVQYDYNDEIYVVSSKYGEANFPDEKGENGQRPEDIEKEYTKNAEELQSSFEQYLEEMQSNYATE